MKNTVLRVNDVASVLGVIRHHQRRIVASHRKEDKRKRKRVARRGIKRGMAFLPRGRV